MRAFQLSTVHHLVPDAFMEDVIAESLKGDGARTALGAAGGHGADLEAFVDATTQR